MNGTQANRVLAALYRHQEHGITRVDFARFPTIDGGPPIINFPARIEELRKIGFPIESCERREKCVVYRLRELQLTLDAA